MGAMVDNVFSYALILRISSITCAVSKSAVQLDGTLIDENGKSSKVTLQKSVRIVFFLTLNGRAVRQVFRLLKALFHKDHYFLIHVDSVRIR